MRAAGLKIQIKQTRRQHGRRRIGRRVWRREVSGWEVRLPDGRLIPQVEKDYTYLGSKESAVWEGAQDGVRKHVHVVRECSRLLRMIGRAGLLGERQVRVAMGLAIEGTIGFYGRATAIGWDACEEIERVRAEVLRQRGFSSGRDSAQIHADRRAGGLDHRHAYQHASAVLIDEIESTMDGASNTPSHIAVTAHMRATCIRLEGGWSKAT
jgi:hypothetical protein